MTSKEPKLTDTKPTAVPLSSDFCADDADVIIRAAGAFDFRVHKCILSLISPVFKDMFTIPQPPTDTPGTLPRVDVTESPGTWEIILRTIYPMPTPVIGSIDDLESLLLAAKKYEMRFVVDSHEYRFMDRGFMQEDPLRLYAIACACGVEDWAKYVARNAENLAVTRRSNAGSLEGLTIASYHRLISFLAERDNEWNDTVSKVSMSLIFACSCDKRFATNLCNKIKENLKWPTVRTEDVYLRALEERIRLRHPGCTTAKECSMSEEGIKAFIEHLVAHRENLCDQFIGDTQYVQ